MGVIKPKRGLFTGVADPDPVGYESGFFFFLEVMGHDPPLCLDLSRKLINYIDFYIERNNIKSVLHPSSFQRVGSGSCLLFESHIWILLVFQGLDPDPSHCLDLA